MEEITGTLEHWSRHQVTNKEFIIYGHLYDDVHKRWENGYYIHTSGILNRKLAEGDIVNTKNSTYLLGKRRT